ncbi:MAG TPA: DUF302 domain-containing protein [Acidimicrobiia bacterium]|nr:DUF302 domain-containing protein [Acidimicrobiia bacterium]
MTSSTHSRTVRRLTIDIDAPLDDFRARYEEAVPAYDLASRLPQLPDWDAATKDVEQAAPYGFLRYGTIDASPAFAIAGHKARSFIYLMGNHLIAETMYRHNPAIMLYAPLRLCLYEDLDGQTHFSVDQPSDQFGSFDDPDISATGNLLDGKLADLLRGLGVTVPDTLT